MTMSTHKPDLGNASEGIDSFCKDEADQIGQFFYLISKNQSNVFRKDSTERKKENGGEKGECRSSI